MRKAKPAESSICLLSAWAMQNGPEALRGRRRSSRQMYFPALSATRQKLSLRTAIWAASLCSLLDKKAACGMERLSWGHRAACGHMVESIPRQRGVLARSW